MNITKKLFGVAPLVGSNAQAEGKVEIYKYTITNASGASVELCSIGAGVLAINVPDRDGRLADVVLGYPKAESYFGDGPCAGKCPGRYANRIAEGKFSLDGQEYSLPINNGPNHLHGGPEGFQNKVWDSRVDGDAVEFMYFSADGEMGYPGNVKVVARYEWSEENELRLTFTACTDKATVLNLTNHSYFNLNGEGSGSVLDHQLTLYASEYLPTTESLIPLGDSVPVAGTPMDFVNPKVIGQDIKKDFPALKAGKGYDNCWVIDAYAPGQLCEAAKLYAPKTGRILTMYTTQPGIQIYTGNWLTGCPEGKNGHIYNDYDFVALEAQHYPDSPNHADYPTTTLRPGETYEQAIIWAFGVE